MLMYVHAGWCSRGIPQCFLNLNRKNEKNKIIKKGLNELKKQINVIKPNVYFSWWYILYIWKI